MSTFPRVSGRTGQTLDLNITFYQNGIPTDPYMIRKVSIYKISVAEENLVAEVLIPPLWDPTYPSPVERELIGSEINPGVYHLLWDVPKTLEAPDIYFDVWSFIPSNPGLSNVTGGTSGVTDNVSDSTLNESEQALIDDESNWEKFCNKFWLYPESFAVDTGLESIQLGFEAIQNKFYQPAVQKLEVGIMPLPLYEFDYNLIAPIIPQLKATFTLKTHNNELLVDHEAMTIGIRTGTYRSCPFVLQYLFDTTLFIKGSYKYRVEVTLPNGELRVSPDFIIQVN